jgi:hypothetical protein
MNTKSRKLNVSSNSEETETHIKLELNPLEKEEIHNPEISTTIAMLQKKENIME